MALLNTFAPSLRRAILLKMARVKSEHSNTGTRLTISTDPAVTTINSQRVIGREFVAILAVRLKRIDAVPHILKVRDSPEVIGVDTGAYATEVVQLHATGDGSVEKLPSEFMRPCCDAFTVSVYGSIPPVGQATLPNPTRSFNGGSFRGWLLNVATGIKNKFLERSCWSVKAVATGSVAESQFGVVFRPHPRLAWYRLSALLAVSGRLIGSHRFSSRKGESSVRAVEAFSRLTARSILAQAVAA